MATQVNHPAPLAVQAPGRVTVNLKGHTSAVVPFTVRDVGTQPVTITLSAGAFTVNEQAYPGASWVTGISPASFKLNPGQARTAHLTITVPPGAQGTHYAGIEVLASPATSADHSKQAHVGGAVASALVLQRPGHVAAVVPPSSPADYAAPVVIGALSAVLLSAAGLAVLGVRWRRRRRSRRLAAIRAHRDVANGRHRAGRTSEFSSLSSRHG